MYTMQLKSIRPDPDSDHVQLLPRELHAALLLASLYIAMLAPNFTANAIPPDPRVEKTPTYTPDEVPSCGGHGTLEILEVTRFLERHGIECCIVGVSALMFYGAGRVRDVRGHILRFLFKPQLLRGKRAFVLEIEWQIDSP